MGQLIVGFVSPNAASVSILGPALATSSLTLVAEIASSRYALLAMTALFSEHAIHVIASQRVRPLAGPMTGSAKQSRRLL
jgi:hypothetical protein